MDIDAKSIYHMLSILYVVQLVKMSNTDYELMVICEFCLSCILKSYHNLTNFRHLY